MLEPNVVRPFQPIAGPNDDVHRLPRRRTVQLRHDPDLSDVMVAHA